MNVKTASCDFLTYILAFALEQSREAGYGGQLIREDNRTGENFYFFMEVTPLEHSIIDPFRFVKRSM